MKDYGGALRALRKRMGLTQAQLAEKLNVTYQAVSKWENNINQPDLEALEKICKTFSVTVDGFLRMAEKDNSADEVQPAQEIGDRNETTERPAQTESVVPIRPEPRPMETTSAASGVSAAEKKKKDDKVTLIICLSVAVAYVVAMLLTFFIPFGIAKSRKSESQIHTDTDKSMFRIVGRTDDGDLVGSGFFIDKKGTAVTDYRVIEDAKSATARLGGVTYNVDKLLGFDASLGLAVIHVDIPSSKPLRNANSDKIKEDDKVYAVYYESIIKSTITSGMVLSPSDERDGVKYVRTTAYVDNDVDYGGGPLVNSKGKVVGVVVGKIKIDGLAYRNLAIPVNAVSDIKRDVNLTLEDYYALRSKKVKITYMLEGEKYATYQVKGVDGHKPPVPTAEFADFDGWYTKADYTDKYKFTGKYDNNITLYGRFLYGKPVLSFDLGGADGSIPAMRFESDTVLPECTAAYTGYSFDGWKYDKVYAAGEKPNLSPELKRVTFTAVWKPIEYSLEYAYSGITTVELTYGKEYKLENAIYTRAGYKMSGWEIDKKTYALGETVKDLSAVQGNTVVASPIWEPITFFVEIDINTFEAYFDGVKYAQNDTIRVACKYNGSTLGKEHSIKTDYGLVFEDWTAYNDDGSEYDGRYDTATTEEDKTVKVRANWRSGYYELRVDYDESFMFLGLDMTGYQQYVLPTFAYLCGTFGKTVPAGYYFKCWVNKHSLDPNNPVRYNDGQTVSNLMVDGFDRQFRPFVHLIPEYAPIEYNISFGSGGGQGNMDSIECKFNETVTLPECTFTKDGYRFIGWKSGDSFFKIGQSVSNLTETAGATVTLTAQWMPAYQGEGTEGNPYKIGNFTELKNLSQWAELVNDAYRAYYELTADIDCDGGEIYPVSFFEGNFDGKGHVIRDPVFVTSEYFAGLFGSVRGTITDLGIEGYGISVGRGCSAAPLCLCYSGKLENCYASGSIVALDPYERDVYISGLVGEFDSDASAENCHASGSVTVRFTENGGSQKFSEAYVGGFVAYARHKTAYKSCYGDVDITVGGGYDNLRLRVEVGGFAASIDQCGFADCYSLGDVSLPEECKNDLFYCGLFVGFNYYGTYTGVYVSGTLTLDGEPIEDKAINGITRRVPDQTDG